MAIYLPAPSEIPVVLRVIGGADPPSYSAQCMLVTALMGAMIMLYCRLVHSNEILE